MPTPTKLQPEPSTVTLLDRSERESAVAIAVAAAELRSLKVDQRCRELLQRYIDGELTDVQLVAEIKRPYLQ